MTHGRSPLYWLVLGAIGTGCFSKPDRPGSAPGDDDAATAPACTDPPVEDDFNDTTQVGCGAGFAGSSNGATLERTGGVLQMSLPSGVASSDASCSWSSGFDEGVFIEVRKSAGSGGTYTIMQVSTTPQNSVHLSVTDGDEAIFQMRDSLASPEIITSMPYIAADMRWWRLRPDDGVIVGEYSADGRAWQRIGASITPPPTGTTSVHLNAGNFQALGVPSMTELDNFNVCPP